MTELKNIIGVWNKSDLPDYLIGLLPNKTTVTLISKEDGSLPYPDLVARSIEDFSENFFLIVDTNALSFLFDKRNGTKLIPEQILSGSVWNDSSIKQEEKHKINKFYNEHWACLNDDYYIYEDEFTELVALVKKDNFEIALPKWYLNIRVFNENIFILRNENRAYRIVCVN